MNMPSSHTQCTHTTPTGSVRTEAATLKSYPRHGHMTYLREIASWSCKAWYRRCILPSRVHTDGCDVGQVSPGIAIISTASREPASSRPCSPVPTLSGHGQGSRMCQPWRILKRKPFVALIGFMGSVGILQLLMQSNGTTITKLPSILSSMQSNYESLQICCQKPQTSNSVHWEVLFDL